MRLLLFSDLHCDLSAASQLVKLARGVDVVVGAGDLGHLRHGVDRTIEALKSIELPAVLVPGNSESFEELQEAAGVWPTAHVLHGTRTTIDGIEFFGFGGGVPVTPFGDWSYDFTEDYARENISGCPRGCVLVTHSPPHGVVDVSSRGKNLGSRAIREIIEERKPRLAVCGHIHESGGKRDSIGDTPVINAGPSGLIWQL